MFLIACGNLDFSRQLLVYSMCTLGLSTDLCYCCMLWSSRHSWPKLTTCVVYCLLSSVYCLLSSEADVQPASYVSLPPPPLTWGGAMRGMQLDPSTRLASSSSSCRVFHPGLHRLLSCTECVWQQDSGRGFPWSSEGMEKSSPSQASPQQQQQQQQQLTVRRNVAKK